MLETCLKCKGIWGSGSIAQTFLTSELDAGELSAVRPDRFTAEESALGTQPIGGFVGPRAGLDVIEKIRYLFSLPGIESLLLGHPARSLVAILTELSRLLIYNKCSGFCTNLCG
jgi:hypothetical protein